MKSLVILFVLGLGCAVAAPTDENSSQKVDFGNAVEHALNQFKAVIPCFYKEPNHFITHHDILEEPFLGINLTNWKWNLNITKFKAYGFEKFDVLESYYNESSKRFNFGMKFDGPRVEGSYSFKNNASDSRFDLEFDGYSNFAWKTHPGILNVSWTFGSNETTNNLTVSNVNFTITSLDGSKMSFLDDVFNEIPSHPMISSNLSSIGDHYYKDIDELGAELIEVILETLVADFKSVEELASVPKMASKEMFNFAYDCFDKKEE